MKQKESSYKDSCIMRQNNTWLFILFLFISLSAVAQKKPVKKEPAQKQVTSKTSSPSKTDVAADEKKVRDMVSFLEFMLNTLGNSSTPTRDKEVLITESYSKIFRDSKVQIEDDLDEERIVITNKDVVAYLKDVNFFFKQARFEFTIEEISSSVTSTGEQFYKVSTTRNLKATTADEKVINSTQPRFIEINYNPKDQDLKIVSMYTNQFDEKRALTIWWNDLSLEWKSVFKGKLNLKDSVDLNDLKKIASITELDISQNEFIMNLDPLSQLADLSSLNISGTQVADLTPIRNLSELVKLNLSHTKINQLTALKYAIKLEELKLNHTLVTDLSPLMKLTNLKRLEVKDIPIAEFSFMESLTTLQVVDLSQTQIRELSSFENLTQLIELNLSETYVIELAPLRQLKLLEVLDLDSTQIQNLAPLSGLTNLKTLSINHTPISELTPLEKLMQLEKIYCDQTLIKRHDAEAFMVTRPSTLVIFDSKDLKAWWDQLPVGWKKTFSGTARISEAPSKEELAKVPIIDSVNIGGKSEIRNLEPLRKLQRIRVLIAYETGISDLSPLRNHPEIQWLDISKTEVTDVSVMVNLKALKVLKANDCKIENISSLKVNSLISFYADQSRIDDLIASKFLQNNPACLIIYKTDRLKGWWSGLSLHWRDAFLESMDKGKDPTSENLHRLTQLEKFQFKDIPVASLTPLTEFVRLRELHFSGTNLINISPIESIKSLKSLHATNSPIMKLDSLELLTELEDLDISNTPIEDIYPLWKLKEMKKLNCAGTQIKRLDVLEKLEKLEFLDCSNTFVSKLSPLDYLPLKTLKCYNTKVSTKAIENFKASHPDCNVIYYR